MPLSKIVIAILIHLITPLLGAGAFLFLCWRMIQAQIQLPPFFSYFVLFCVYGGWLIVALTAGFWEWSGMASIGVAGLVFVAPFVTASLARNLRQQRGLSGFHRGAYFLSIGYCGIMLAAVLTWIAIWVFAKTGR